MLIPLSHDSLEGRRWPYVTIAIIAMNVLVFLFTNGRLEHDGAASTQTRQHILVLAARFPDVEMTAEGRNYVEAFRHEHASAWKMLTAENRRPLDAWEARLLVHDPTPEQLNTEMAQLCEQMKTSQSESILWNYGYHSYQPTPQSYITSMFLHGGWMHLIFNMWFLWLAGTILEDRWGRLVYPLFYFAAGLAATFAHALTNPNSTTSAIGASGAVAGLMGAFLVRFPKVKMKFLWFFFFRARQVSMAAWVFLPFWALREVFAGMLGESNVAHWAHVGGFVAGALGAFVVGSVGIEKKVSEKVDAEQTWEADPELVALMDMLPMQAEAAIAEAKRMLAANPNRPDAADICETLLRAQEQLGQHAGACETLARLVHYSLIARESQMAWEHYEQFRRRGGKKLDAADWLELCRFLEREQNWERAASEYKELAAQHSGDRVSLTALISAARIFHTRLNRADEAATMYRTAQTSPVPHLDMDGIIEHGLKQCAVATAGVRVAATTA
jgi:membrane associated rhomboid family serine protease